MKTVFSIGLSSLLLLVLAAGCSKDEETPTATRTEMITSSDWKFEKATANGFDISAQIDACIKDNTITFSTNGSGAIAEGPIVCPNPAPPTFTWNFQNNETELKLSTPLITGGSDVFNIVTLNQINLVISQDMTIPPLPTSTVVITLKH